MEKQTGWTALEFVSTVGAVSFQWDGGADAMIHGNWSRRLPDIDLYGAYLVGDAREIVLTVIADGVGPTTIRLPVQTIDKRS